MENFKSKNILITGGAGFIGSCLVNRLVEQEHNVVVIDNLSSGKRENVSSKVKFYEMDVCNPKISQVFQDENIEIVFHLAAQPIVETAYKNPFKTIETNIMGTVNILETCRLKGDVKSIVVTSSDKAYGKSEKLPYTEDVPLKGDHPYEVSKSCADLIATAYFKTYRLPIAITRFSNVFGPGDFNFNRIIPGILKSIITNTELLVRSDGKMIREYTYVADIADGCVKLAENIETTKGEAFNFGSKNIFSVIQVIEKIEEILEIKVNYQILNTTKNEIPEQYLDWTKINKVLEWQPEVSFEQGIKRSFDWYRNFYSTK